MLSVRLFLSVYLPVAAWMLGANAQEVSNKTPHFKLQPEHSEFGLRSQFDEPLLPELGFEPSAAVKEAPLFFEEALPSVASPADVLGIPVAELASLEPLTPLEQSQRQPGLVMDSSLLASTVPAGLLDL